MYDNDKINGDQVDYAEVWKKEIKELREELIFKYFYLLDEKEKKNIKSNCEPCYLSRYIKSLLCKYSNKNNNKNKNLLYNLYVSKLINDEEKVFIFELGKSCGCDLKGFLDKNINIKNKFNIILGNCLNKWNSYLNSVFPSNLREEMNDKLKNIKVEDNTILVLKKFDILFEYYNKFLKDGFNRSYGRRG